MRYIAVGVTNESPETATVETKVFPEAENALYWLDQTLGQTNPSQVLGQTNPDTFCEEDLWDARPTWMAAASNQGKSCFIVRAPSLGRITLSIEYQLGYGMAPTRYVLDKVFKKRKKGIPNAGITVYRTPTGISVSVP